jgi:glycosyltransferase involved in cell wall biosynthesis
VTPKVGIVVPCWNAGSFLPGLFESLDAQTFRDFEVIMVDDGSTDASTLETLAHLPPGVTLVRQENRGLSAARNSGFRATAADLVLPLDCDDRLEPEFLALGVARLAEEAALDFVFSHMRLIGARTGTLERRFNRFDQLFLNQLPYSLLMRKAAWVRVGGYDESMRDGYEDWDFNLRLIRTGSAGAAISAVPLFLYRVADDGMLLSKSARKHAALWRKIRQKHPGAYRPSALMALHRREGRGKVALPTATALLAATQLPAPWFGRLYRELLGRRGRRKG